MRSFMKSLTSFHDKLTFCRTSWQASKEIIHTANAQLAKLAEVMSQSNVIGWSINATYRLVYILSTSKGTVDNMQQIENVLLHTSQASMEWRYKMLHISNTVQ